MKIRIARIALAMFVVASSHGSAAPGNPPPGQSNGIGHGNPHPEPFVGEVLKVANGADLRVHRDDGRQYLVRVYGMHAPARDEAVWHRTRQWLDEQLVGQNITVDPKGEGPYHSLVAEVFLADGSILAEVLVRDGLAWWDLVEAPEYHRLQNLQDDARGRKVGIWALPEPKDPREQRRTGLVVPAVGRN